MNGEAVDRITDLAQMKADGVTTVIDGQTYSTRALTHIAKYEPLAKTNEKLKATQAVKLSGTSTLEYVLKVWRRFWKEIALSRLTSL